ncbi:uncharacterized protein C8A04DRAFT_13652 [Dichotomopilus funicola]|uniref:Protein kinase domain-containing protein n=1 Tax=Dichotomopilus funicola TaxID=1934379 RepID=A0AAN6ZKM9_9PEZI|nr:hypothetical protein C8A04DRAFT_13652 [Dichotomopilus funicola]
MSSSPSSSTDPWFELANGPHTGKTYWQGKSFLIRKHCPPEPFQVNGHYRDNPRPIADWDLWGARKQYGIDRLEFALAYPPMDDESHQHPSTGNDTVLERSLTITGSKTRRNNDNGSERRGAHVLTCFLDGDATVEYIAKIYDGVDYPGSYQEPDCMTLADMDYSIEACAYRNLQSIPGVGGVLVPAYFGSWTFALDNPNADADPNGPAAVARQRWVRMILIELVPGECLLDMIERARVPVPSLEPTLRPITTTNYSVLPPEAFRIRVIRNIIEADIIIWWEALLTNHDFHPRNIMVKPDGKVVIIDFNHAQLFEFTTYGDVHPRQREPGHPDALTQPESPIERYWAVPFGSVAAGWVGDLWKHWMPESWVKDPDQATEWLVATFRDDTRFAPLSHDFLNCYFRTKCSPRAQKLLEDLGREPAGKGAEKKGKEIDI